MSESEGTVIEVEDVTDCPLIYHTICRVDSRYCGPACPLRKGDVTVRLKEAKGKKQAREITKNLMHSGVFTGKKG